MLGGILSASFTALFVLQFLELGLFSRVSPAIKQPQKDKLTLARAALMPAPHPTRDQEGALSPCACSFNLPHPSIHLPNTHSQTWHSPAPTSGKMEAEDDSGVREDQGLFRALRSLDEKSEGWGAVKRAREASGAQEQVPVHSTHPLPRLRFLSLSQMGTKQICTEV